MSVYKQKLLGAVTGIFSIFYATGAAASDANELLDALADAKAQLNALQLKVDQLESQIESSAQVSVVELEERVEDLEIVAAELDESIGSRAIINAFDGIKIDVGGFFDTAATTVIGEEATDTSFNRQVFELLIKAELGPKWDLFVAQAFIRNAALTYTDPQQRTTPSFGNNNSPVATDTVIAWGQYHHSDALNVQFGRFTTPLGIINIEHFPASLLDTEQPQFLRMFSGQNIFANFTNGLNVYGSKYFGQNALGYAAYAGFWAGNSTNATFGGRFDYNIGERGITIGINGLSGDRARDITGDRFYGIGMDLHYDKGPFLWKSELFATSEGSGDDRLAFYTQPSIRLSGKWTVLYRYDFFDNGDVGGKSTEHVGGLVFDPIHNVRLRALYRFRTMQADVDFQETNSNVIQFATTFNF